MMGKKLMFFTFILFCFCVEADIRPEVKIPGEVDINKFLTMKITKLSYVDYIQEADGCNDVVFKDYFFLKKTIDRESSFPKNYPIQQWFCLFSSGVYEDGYDNGIAERVVYSKEKSLWIKEKTEPSDVIASDQKNPYKPLALYNIVAKDSKGYAVIDENITSNERFIYGSQRVKKVINFCLIQDYTYIAFCGSGDLISNFNGNDVDLTPYVLMSLESMEIGVNNRVNEIMRKHSDKPMPE